VASGRFVLGEETRFFCGLWAACGCCAGWFVGLLVGVAICFDSVCEVVRLAHARTHAHTHARMFGTNGTCPLCLPARLPGRAFWACRERAVYRTLPRTLFRVGSFDEETPS